MGHRGMKLGIFVAPFHRVFENPTLALARENRRTILGRSVEAIRPAYRRAAREVPAEFLARTSEARDIGPTIP